MKLVVNIIVLLFLKLIYSMKNDEAFVKRTSLIVALCIGFFLFTTACSKIGISYNTTKRSNQMYTLRNPEVKCCNHHVYNSSYTKESKESTIERVECYYMNYENSDITDEDLKYIAHVCEMEVFEHIVKHSIDVINLSDKNQQKKLLSYYFMMY